MQDGLLGLAPGYCPGAKHEGAITNGLGQGLRLSRIPEKLGRSYGGARFTPVQLKRVHDA